MKENLEKKRILFVKNQCLYPLCKLIIFIWKIQRELQKYPISYTKNAVVVEDLATQKNASNKSRKKRVRNLAYSTIKINTMHITIGKPICVSYVDWRITRLQNVHIRKIINKDITIRTIVHTNQREQTRIQIKLRKKESQKIYASMARMSQMGITCSTLPQNNDNLPLPFFNGNCPIVLLVNIYSFLYVY